MRTRSLIVTILAFVVAFAMVWSAAAQGPEPRSGDRATPVAEPPRPDGGLAPRSLNSPAVALGQPGTSFRYVQTFGTTEEAYPNPGTSYLNSPGGLYIDGGNNLYVVEDHGYRLLRYTAGGVNTLVLGTAGLCIDRNTPVGYCAPQDVALDGSSNIWLATDSRIAEFDTNGVFLQQLPTRDSSGNWSSGSDHTHFSSANGVAFDHIGHMFVSDGNNHRIEVYSFSGSNPVYSTTIGVTGIATSTNAGFNFPRRLAVDSSNRLFVADSNNGRVQRCVFSSAWSCTTLDGGLNNPQGVGIDGADNIYIADSSNDRVVKCNAGGSCSDLITNLVYGLDVAVDSTGNVFLDGWGHGVVRKYNSSGSFVGEFVGVYDVGYITNTVDINAPWGIAVAGDGSIYLTEHYGYRVLKLNSSGVQQWALGMPGAIGSGNYQFNQLEGKPAVTADNRLLVPDAGNNRIQIYGTNGVYQATFGSFGTSGNDKFNFPNGIALSPINGDIYIADRNNHRIQVYDTNLNYKATLGVTGISGTDAAHFNQPRDVTLDSGGKIYVADFRNNRVQKCTLSGINFNCATFAGVTTVAGSDFNHFNRPTAVAVDGAGRVYVADEGNYCVQVFDASGAYLTTIGQSWGNLTGQLRSPSGVAIDTAGYVYVTDRENHRIQKFAPGVPNWRQRNINGFGDRTNGVVTTLSAFGGQLYAGTYDWNGTGAQIWRTSDGVVWTPVITNGFGITRNASIDHLYAFNGQLYAGTWADAVNGGEVWRSSDGSVWNQVVSAGFGDVSNGEVYRLGVFNNTLYAATWSYTSTHGTEIWRSSTGNAGDWTRVVSNGFGMTTTFVALAIGTYNGNLYVGTYDNSLGGQVWRSSSGDGGSWTQVNANGFGNTSNHGVTALDVFNGYLYAGTSGPSGFGSEIWRCQTCDGTDWMKVVDNGFGNSNNRGEIALEILNGYFYASTTNFTTGMEVWRSSTGNVGDWVQVGFAGFGNSNNWDGYWDNALTTFDGNLYTGTQDDATGGQVWEYLDKQLFLPAILR
jgi:sugar lactone lactonase YvrE